MAVVKCPECGYELTFSVDALGKVDTANGFDMFTVCPIITERQNAGQRTDLGPINCPHLRVALAESTSKYRHHHE